MEEMTPIQRIQKIRSEQMHKKARNDIAREQALKNKENIQAFFNSLKEEDINALEKEGIYIRKLMQYDLDKVITVREVNEAFRKEFDATVGSILNLIERVKTE